MEMDIPHTHVPAIHDRHDKVADCEECGRPICACKILCDDCQEEWDALNSEVEARAQAYADFMECPSKLD